MMPSRKKITVHLTPLQLAALYESAIYALYCGICGPRHVRQAGATRRGAVALHQAFTEIGEEWPL